MVSVENHSRCPRKKEGHPFLCWTLTSLERTGGTTIKTTTTILEKRNTAMGSQHPSPNVKNFPRFEPQIWPEIITSRDAESTCFKGSRTSCREIIFGIFGANFGQKRSHHVMDASCRSKQAPQNHQYSRSKRQTTRKIIEKRKTENLPAPNEQKFWEGGRWDFRQTMGFARFLGVSASMVRQTYFLQPRGFHEKNGNHENDN